MMINYGWLYNCYHQCLLVEDGTSDMTSSEENEANATKVIEQQELQAR